MIPQPYFYEKEGNFEKGYDLYSRLLKERIILLFNEINDDLACTVIAQLLFLESVDPEKDIYMYINSPGGSVTAGLAIHDTIKRLKCDVSTICVGSAASMGAFLLASGTKGKRLSLENSEIMIHQVLIGGRGIQGQATEIQIETQHLLRVKERLNKILSKYTGKTVEQVTKDTERNFWMFAEEACDYGLIDRIIAGN
jgi:ATP-dependent Clp protease, protease subunit